MGLEKVMEEKEIMVNRYDMTQIKGVIPAMLTFFDKEENVDTECTRNMVEFMLDKGADGFYLTGSTGECFTMTMEERNQVVDTVIDQVKGRVPVIVHVGDIGTRKSIELAKYAYGAGADAISSVPPFYWKFSGDDIYNYYKDISESVPLPMVIYNIQLAGLMDMELLLKLADLKNVRGLKYTARSHDEMGYLKEKLGKKFMIYSGCDEMAFSGLCAGADGIIGSFYNLFPDLFKAIAAKVEESDIKGGVRLQKIGNEVIFAALRYDFPSVLHGMMRWRGLEPGYSRRPFYNYQDDELEGLKEDIRRIKDKYQAAELDMFDF